MTCTIHQPTFLPYLGFFRKVFLADVFIAYDTAQYPKNDWHNRNRIKTERGVEWLSVPISCHLGDDFQKAKPTDGKFIKSHLGKITQAYRRAPFFQDLFPKFEEAYRQPGASLSDFNMTLLSLCFDLLGLHPEIRFSHEFDLGGAKATEALIALNRAVGAEIYLGGIDTEKYADMALFEQAGIEVRINDFQARPYAQQWGGVFEPNLSVIDALFNIGPDGTRQQIEFSR